MDQGVDHDELDGILRRCGATWNASQAHGFLCSRIAVRGTEALSPWIEQLLAGAGNGHAMRGECETALESLFHITWRSLAERQSDFVLVLPGDERPAAERADALAHWCEGFLHGLVSGAHPEALRVQLATEPLSDIIKDMLEITRAAADEETDEESNDAAYAELVEYIRVAAQLAFEELAGFRARETRESGPDPVH
jgi:uncharacterized protein